MSEKLTQLLKAGMSGYDDVSSWGRANAQPLDPAVNKRGPVATLTKNRPIEEIPMDTKTKARAQFLTWLKESDPEAFEQILQKMGMDTNGNQVSLGDIPPINYGLYGMGQTDGEDTRTWWQKLADTVTSLGTAVIGYKTQKNILETNLQRAEQGLPPLDMSEGAPVVKTQVDISPEIMAKLQESAAAGMQNILLFGGIALAAFFLLGGRKRR